MYRPRIDDIWHLVPESVKDEQDHFGGDPEVVGFCPALKGWINTSTIAFVEFWRACVMRRAAEELGIARKQQVVMNEYATALYANATKGSVRMRAVIHPTIKRWMETIHGAATFTDRESIADTERLQPKMFFNN